MCGWQNFGQLIKGYDFRGSFGAFFVTNLTLELQFFRGKFVLQKRCPEAMVLPIAVFRDTHTLSGGSLSCSLKSLRCYHSFGLSWCTNALQHLHEGRLRGRGRTAAKDCVRWVRERDALKALPSSSSLPVSLWCSPRDHFGRALRPKLRADFLEGDEWGQQLFSFQSPAVQWMARTSSLNCLSCRNPYQTPDSLNCLPPFHWKPHFFHWKVLHRIPFPKIGSEKLHATLHAHIADDVPSSIEDNEKGLADREGWRKELLHMPES